MSDLSLLCDKSAKKFKKSGTRIVIAWNGLPIYGAWQIRAVRDLLGDSLSVIATQPDVPVEGIEEIIEAEVHWIDRNQKVDWKDIGLETPDILIHTGWAYPAFNHLGNAVRARKGKVIAMVDNCWQGNLRQLFGAVKYRLCYKRWFWGVLVPGASGRKLCRVLGVPNRRIFEGLYGANPDLFQSGQPLNMRPKKFIFVARLIERKGVPELAKAWRRFHSDHPDWKLQVYGNGPMRSMFEAVSGVELNEFAPSEIVAKAMQSSRVLLLPSRKEHWGVVIHEAACCGCACILSDQVGSRYEFAGRQNCHIVKSKSAEAIYNSMCKFAELSETKWKIAYEESLQFANNFGPKRYAYQILNILKIMTIG